MLPSLLLFAFSQCFAADNGLEIPFEKLELDNGLEVILSPDHSTPVVYVSVWYHVGSKDETHGLSGFAHLFEHLMFQGSLSYDNEYFGPLQEVGASINGSTSFDRTNYYEYLPAQHLPRALFMESDRMGYLLDVLSQDKLDNQREVVRNERRQNYENPPYGDVYGLLSENMFAKDHPYGHLPIGSHEDLQAASLETVKAFFKTWYAPNNASLVIAGDFDMAQTKELVKEYFGPIAKGETPKRLAAEPAVLSETKVVVVHDDVPERKVWMSWHSPALYQPGDADLDLFSSIFGSGTDSRLHKKLVREKKLAKSIYAYQMSGMLSSRYMIVATVNDDHTTTEVVAEVDAVLRDFLENSPPTDLEISASKANYELTFYQSQETIRGKGETLQLYNMYHGDPNGIQADLDRYLKATPESLMNAVRETLLKHRFELHYLPNADKGGE
jgi:zinc protease